MVFRKYAQQCKQHLRLDYCELAIAFCGIVASLIFFFHSDNNAYTNDLPGHIAYIRYILNNWPDIYGYRGWEANHPPYYYLLAIAVAKPFMALIPGHLLSVCRLLSLPLYYTFLGFGMALCRRVIPNRADYLLAITLLVFWSSGFVMATKISNDIVYYACYSPSIYYLVRWQREQVLSLLYKSLTCAAFALLFKFSAVMLFALIASFMAWEMLRGRLTMRALLNRRSLYAAALILLCLTLDTWNAITANTPEARRYVLGGGTGPEFQLSSYFYLNFNLADFIQSPFVTFHENSAWQMFFKSLLFEDTPWNYMGLASILCALLCVLVLYTLLPILFYSRHELAAAAPWLVMILIPMAFIFGISMFRNVYPYIDARFVHPSLIAFVILFAQSRHFYRTRGWPSLTAIGLALPLLFALVSVIFFDLQIRPAP